MRLNAIVIFTILCITFLSWLIVGSSAFTETVKTETKVCVFPSEVEVNLGGIFTVYLNVCNVDGLQGFDLMLRYNTKVLDCLGVEEGDFMRSFGDTFIAKQEIADNFSADFGRVWFAAAILGKGYANGSGTLVTVKFKAVAIGESVLDLYSDLPYRSDEVKLATCGSVPISNVAVDGHVVVSSSNNSAPPDPPEPPSSDVNGDGTINIMDLAIIAQAYGSSIGELSYDVRADLDQNGFVDIHDVSICARMFGSKV